MELEGKFNVKQAKCFAKNVAFVLVFQTITTIILLPLS